ncbi:MAG: AAA family ATPase [Gammaproteobacteria bacterium]
MKVIACYNVKGGVGKTATAVNLGHCSASEGYRTLVWDLDPQGAATFYFRIKPRIKGGGKKLVRGKTALADRIKATDYRGLDLLPADPSYRHMDLILGRERKPAKRLAALLASLEDEYDQVILDCAPTLSLVTEAVFNAADALIIPLIPTPLSLRAYSQILDFRKRKGSERPILIPFFSMVDRRKRIHRHIVETLPDRYPAFPRVEIPCCAEVERMGELRAPVAAFARNSRVVSAYNNLWATIVARTGGASEI